MISSMVRRDHVRRHDGRRRIGAHAAGVRAGVAVADALVILRGSQRQRGLAVDEGEEACLLAFEKFLDHDLGAGRAERAGEARVDGRLGLGRASSAMTTPLPAASPSALTTIGAPCVARYALAVAASLKRP